MPNTKKLEDISSGYFLDHPEEIDDFIKECFEDYAQDGDSSVLLSQLRMIARVKGISSIAEKIGMTRQGLQKTLSAKGNPRLDNINAIMKAMGYSLMVHKQQPLDAI